MNFRLPKSLAFLTSWGSPFKSYWDRRDSREFFEEMEEASNHLRTQVSFGSYFGVGKRVRPKGLDTLKFYQDKVDAGWRINPQVEQKCLGWQKSSYASLQIVEWNEKTRAQEAMVNTTRFWKLLKEAGCRNFFEVFGVDKNPVLVEKSFSDPPDKWNVSRILSRLNDEIFEKELSDAPQCITYGVEGLIQRLERQVLIQGKHPLQWASDLGLNTLTQRQVWGCLETLNALPTHLQQNAFAEFQRIFHQTKMTITPSRGIVFAYFQEDYAKKFSPEFYPILSDFGFAFDKIHEPTSLKNPLFVIANMGLKDGAKRLEALVVELQKKDPALNLQALMEEKDDKGATILHYFAKNRDLNALKWLQTQGATLSGVDNHGNTLIHWMMKTYSAKHEKTFAPLLSWLIENGVNWNAKNAKGVVAAQKLAKQGTLESLLSSIQVCGYENFKEKNLDGKTAIDILRKRQDRVKLTPVTDKIALEVSLPKTLASTKTSSAKRL